MTPTGMANTVKVDLSDDKFDTVDPDSEATSELSTRQYREPMKNSKRLFMSGSAHVQVCVVLISSVPVRGRLVVYC
jgi:hypothetical protein